MRKNLSMFLVEIFGYVCGNKYVANVTRYDYLPIYVLPYCWLKTKVLMELTQSKLNNFY